MNFYRFHKKTHMLRGYKDRESLIPEHILYDVVMNGLKPTDKQMKKLSKDPYIAVQYAGFIKKPFPLGEKAIAKNADCSYQYAKVVLKGPFPLGEPIIALYDYFSFQYATQVIGKRFPLGEPIIKRSPFSYWSEYAEFFGIRWNE